MDTPNTSEDDLKARIAARARLEDPDLPPSLSVVFCNPGDAGENASRRATASGGGLSEPKDFSRLDGESFDAFETRIKNSLPIFPPTMVVFWTDDHDAA
jgi:hypothetical protein